MASPRQDGSTPGVHLGIEHEAGGRTLVDAHVHCHPCFDQTRFLDEAAGNLRRWSREAEPTASVVGILMMTEGRGTDVFGAWMKRVPDGPPGWSFRRTDEGGSLIGTRENGVAIVVVSGRQIRTEEGLEVLAHGTTADIPDGLPFMDALTRAIREARLVSIPWGFGKWTGARGRAVAGLIEEDPPGVYLADNGGRPGLLGQPRLLRRSREAGRAVLGGSDPLPFPRHEGRAGSFGFSLPGRVDPGRPVRWVRNALEARARQVRIWGVRRSLLGFLEDQLRLRARRGPSTGGVEA